MGILSLTPNWPEETARISVNGEEYAADVELTLPVGTYTVEANFLYGYITPTAQEVTIGAGTIVVDMDWTVDTAFWRAIDTRLFPHIRDTFVCRDDKLWRM